MTRPALDRAAEGWATDWPEEYKVPAWEPWRLSYSWLQVPESLKPETRNRVQAACFGRFMIANRESRVRNATAGTTSTLDPYGMNRVI